jgi:3-deoxy-D-manno-octulosonic-acid transferase
MRRFPSPALRLALAAYGALWTLGLPAALLYLRRRARRDPLYGQHLPERFGRHRDALPGAVWVHAVSLGEMRSATPMIRALLDRGDTVVTTHFTPAGRREAERAFAPEIAAGRLRCRLGALRARLVLHRFFRAFRPKYGLVMEIEIWPRMIMAARAAGVPLFMCNAQYPSKSFARDTTRTGLRAELMRGFAGALVKSDLQRDRFAAVGVTNIAVTGELRFAQPIPPGLVAAGQAARARLAPGRRVIAFASVVKGEDDLYHSAIAATRAAHAARGLPPPFVVYIPRAPERFDDSAARLATTGLAILRRSQVFDATFAPTTDSAADILLGDSLGEMYAYLAMADVVVVGGGFTPNGAHNIIEPLALGKPVIVGPETWTIEYPAEEAIAAGICRRVAPRPSPPPSPPTLPDPARGHHRFLADHAGAVERTLAALPGLLASFFWRKILSGVNWPQAKRGQTAPYPISTRTTPRNARASQAAATRSATGRIRSSRGASGSATSRPATSARKSRMAPRNIAFRSNSNRPRDAADLDRGRQEIHLRHGAQAPHRAPPQAHRRKIVHRHAAHRPAVAAKRHARGKIHARIARVAKALAAQHGKPREQAGRDVDLVAKVQQHPAAVRPRCIAVGEAPVRAPLPHVMPDLEMEAVGVRPVCLGQRPQGRVVAHHETQKAPLRHRRQRRIHRLDIGRPESQRLLHIHRPALRAGQFRQRQPHVRRRGDDHARHVSAALHLRPVEGPPRDQLHRRAQALEVRRVAPPDGARADDEDHHPENPPSTLTICPVM